MATCSESNTLEALHGDCYAPVMGMLLMMTMTMREDLLEVTANQSHKQLAG